MDSRLIVLLAPDGQGKTTILQHLLQTQVEVGIVVSLVGDLRSFRPGIVVMDPPPEASPSGQRRIALAGLGLRPGEWLVVDDAETFFDPRLGKTYRDRRDPLGRKRIVHEFRNLIQFRRNLGINVILAGKDPLDFPRQVRNLARVWIVHPGGDVEVLRWERAAGIPVETRLARYEFLVGSPELGWSKFSTSALDSWRLPG